MTINYNVTGPARKKLVQTIAEILECDAKYLGVPSCAYQIDYFTVDKNGSLSFDDRADSDEIEQLIEALCERGFEAEVEAEEIGLEIQMPKSTLDALALDNLRRLLETKGSLIKKALGVDALPITEEDDKVCFPWFSGEPTADEVKAYSHFVSALCEMARNAKRVTAKEKETDNEKYAFRCFLLRLGFIGDAYKTSEKSCSETFLAPVPSSPVPKRNTHPAATRFPRQKTRSRLMLWKPSAACRTRRCRPKFAPF